MAHFISFDLTNYSWFDRNNVSNNIDGPCLSRSNVTDRDWTVSYDDPSSEHSITALVVSQFIVLFVGTIWNLIVLAIILKNKMLKDPTYLLILNLVISDLLFCGLVLPFNIQSSLNREFSLGQSDYARCRSCQTIGALSVTFVSVSYYTLSLLALDRLVYIKWPFKYSRYVSVKLVIVLILILWTLSIVVAILPVIGFGRIDLNALSFCTPVFEQTRIFADSNVYFVLLLLTGLFLFAISLIANVWILCISCKISHKRRQIRHNAAQNATSSNTSNDEKYLLATIFGVLFVINTVLLIPYIVAAVIFGILLKSDIPIPVRLVLNLSFVIQPAIHPILETCVIGKATKAVYKSFHNCCTKRRKVNKK